MRINNFCIILFFLFQSCAKKNVDIPSDVLNQKQMTEILTDLHIAQSAIGNVMTSDTIQYTMDDYVNYILENHHTTKEDFRTSLKFYSDHPEILSEVYDSVITSLSKIEAGLEK
jgi:hypothetical protein